MDPLMTPPLTDAELAEMTQVYGAATEGPWSIDDKGVITAFSGSAILGSVDRVALNDPKNPVLDGDLWFKYAAQSLADGRVMARARTDVPRLVEEVRRLRELTDLASQEIDRLQGEKAKVCAALQAAAWDDVLPTIMKMQALSADAVQAWGRTYGRCGACSHRHLDSRGNMGCAWCPCGHPADCGCAGCAPAHRNNTQITHSETTGPTTTTEQAATKHEDGQ